MEKVIDELNSMYESVITFGDAAKQSFDRHGGLRGKHSVKLTEADQKITNLGLACNGGYKADEAVSIPLFGEEGDHDSPALILTVLCVDNHFFYILSHPEGSDYYDLNVGRKAASILLVSSMEHWENYNGP